MRLSYGDFKAEWTKAGESLEETLLQTAWKRYEQVNSPDYNAQLEGPSAFDLRESFETFLKHSELAQKIISTHAVTVPATTIPWLATGIHLKPGQIYTVFATGRVYRSRTLDLWKGPQDNLWFKHGADGVIFNATRDSGTFYTDVNSNANRDDASVLPGTVNTHATQEASPSDGGSGKGAELYMACQFPGQFENPNSGRVQGRLDIYESMEGKGGYEAFIVAWSTGVCQESLKLSLSKALNDFSDLQTEHQKVVLKMILNETKRMAGGAYRELAKSKHPQKVDIAHRDIAQHNPCNFSWTPLWFLGVNEIYCRDVQEDGDEMIICNPYQNVGIIQKNILPPLTLTENLVASWEWNIKSLPSRLREDTSLSHDYLSIAFEFENGRDITYTWSWELPIDYGYWCPYGTWCDREYHVVIRSGTSGLGEWLAEERHLLADYRKYIGMNNVPKQVTKMWLIAGNGWQRYEGQMLIKKMALSQKN